MQIHRLSPQLINQIAAGEVVERPASVVKELIENSLDAGATRIDIEVELGGAKVIRIRDNGYGISKKDIVLAVARHTTSKISSIEDLECIKSMGFRGEALASISSVAHLNLTSRTAKQNEAWQVYTERYTEKVMLLPIAHPVGTTVEVLDLFYNTPARRKFMRAEQTEFKHIEEVIRRMALARFDVTFILQHNNKIVQHYRAVKEPSQYWRRLSRLCGNTFVNNALKISWQNIDFSIQGWVEDPSCIKLPEMQYSYVNQRIIRNKLINHAIRHAYQDQLKGPHQPSFVIFIVINPQQLDINVHPAKKEIKFYEARKVHHFIYQALMTVLQQRVKLSSDTCYSTTQKPIGKIIPSHALNQLNEGKNNILVSYSAAAKNADELLSNQIIQDPDEAKMQDIPAKCQATKNSCSTSLSNDFYSFGKMLTFCSPCYALLESAQGLSLLSLQLAERYITERQLTPENNSDTILAQPLLIPLRIILSNGEASALHQHRLLLQRMGILLQPNENETILNAVPLPLLRKKNLSNLILDLLRYLNNETSVTYHKIASWLACSLNSQITTWNYSRAIPLIAEVERLCPHWIKNPPNALIVKLDLKMAIKALNNS
ncbi:MAG: DNA mismatch repair endonuclease MutL [Candidatus Baumannia cicadellinicola]|nr:hypothetical protein J6590_098935 [Homalodisca vitripennis]MBS0032539.1 DNA mismatch repair endonuclease MutL [Candidatus Baumannia cicadellinicola]MBS0032885.1 DNA mismatch repair endonuclease MutL [Candidatus Baumannia cicadellinicola]